VVGSIALPVAMGGAAGSAVVGAMVVAVATAGGGRKVGIIPAAAGAGTVDSEVVVVEGTIDVGTMIVGTVGTTARIRTTSGTVGKRSGTASGAFPRNGEGLFFSWALQKITER